MSKKYKTFISILCVLFSLNVWSEDSSAFKISQERIEELDEKNEIMLRMQLMFYMTMLSSIETAQEVNQTIGITSDSTRLMIPYSLGFFIPSYVAVLLLSNTMDARPEWFIKNYLGTKEYQWFLHFNKFISQIVEKSREILSLRAVMELESSNVLLRPFPSERAILKDIRGKEVSSSYNKLYGEGMRRKAIKYQALLNRFEKNPAVPDGEANIKILKSLIQYEKDVIDLKRQLSTYIEMNAYPGLKKHSVVRLVRGFGKLLGMGGITAIGYISYSAMSVGVHDIPNLSILKESLQAEVDYILYRLSEDNAG